MPGGTDCRCAGAWRQPPSQDARTYAHLSRAPVARAPVGSWRELARAGVYQVRPDMTLAEGIAELAAQSDPAAGVRQLPLLDVA